MPEEVLFETESTHSRAEIAAYLRSVADRLDDDGSVSLRAGEESLEMQVPGNLTFEVKAERETSSGASADELSLEFELEWDEGADGGDARGGELSIE
ncbi:amphi-Trp domain-containing protein [Halopelagius longus]|nr:amphi-Trp domain-containing protein [Halopelagius longus]RDI73154.1 amphi-Trp domain-containing protein [Halopelagius longus]